MAATSNERTLFCLCVLLSAAITGLVGCEAQRTTPSSAAAKPVPAASSGQKAPVELQTVSKVQTPGKFNKVLGIGADAPTWADVAGVDDARHSLQDYKDAKVVVQIFTCNNCPVAAGYEDRLVKIARDFKDQGVTLVAINCKEADEEQLAKMKERSVTKGFPFDYLYDPSQNLGRAYGAKVTPEVFVLDANRKVVYMGAIDDSWDAPDNVKQAYLRNAIEAALAGQAPEITETKAVGCSIGY